MINLNEIIEEMIDFEIGEKFKFEDFFEDYYNIEEGIFKNDFMVPRLKKMLPNPIALVDEAIKEIGGDPAKYTEKEKTALFNEVLINYYDSFFYEKIAYSREFDNAFWEWFIYSDYYDEGDQKWSI